MAATNTTPISQSEINKAVWDTTTVFGGSKEIVGGRLSASLSI